MHHRMISIWFFIGSLLLIYGLIILISELVMPTPNVTLAELKPGLWWGLLLTVLGGVYSYMFRPGR
jgi:hypothetical protein